MKKRYLQSVVAFLLLCIMSFMPQNVFAVSHTDYPYNVGPGVYVVDAYGFYQCECTSYVAWRLNSTNGISFHNSYKPGTNERLPASLVSGGVAGVWGHAKDWVNAARYYGYAVNNTPAPGAVFCTTSGGTGHVAWVSGVRPGNKAVIEQYNVGNNHAFMPEEYTIGTKGEVYIHIKDLDFGPTNNPPIGSLDNCSGGLGTVRVAGWAKDNDSPNAQIQVHVYIGGAAGTAGSEGHVLTADGNRSDVGPHAFDVTFDTKKIGSQEVYVYAIDSAGGTNAVIGHTTVNISDPNPDGNLEGVIDRVGSIHVGGWAYDPSDTSNSIKIHVYIGAPSSAEGGEAHEIIANKYRDDVNRVKGCGDYHGFTETIETKKIGLQTVYVYAINVGRGENKLLGTKTVNITDPHPVGVYELVEDKGESIRVKGWAFDPSDTTKSVTIHVYIGAPAGSTGYDFHSITANVFRDDVNRLHKCGDYHGFDAVIPTKKLGNQPVYVYAINLGTGWVNANLGQKDVTITGHIHQLERIPAKEATTSAQGNIEYWKCGSCGKLFKDSNGNTEISIDDTVIPKLQHTTHSWGDWTQKTPATCTTAEVLSRKCSQCEAEETKTGAPAKGHDWGDWTTTTPSTYDAEGEETRICKNDPTHKETRPIAKLVRDDPTPTPTSTPTQTSTPTPTPTQTSTPVPAVVQDPIIIPKTPSSVKTKVKKNKVTISWKKIKKNKAGKKLLSQIKSIQIQASTDPAFSSIVTDKRVGKGKTKVVLNLQKKTTYYIRVRYVSADGVSNWKTKRVRTK